MRIITEKDKRGILVAFRTFIRALNGERIGQTAGNAIIERALEAGIPVDALLNKENWRRASDIMPKLSAKDYVELLSENKVDVKNLTEEDNWHDPNNGFDIIAEAAHDFFYEVSGKGGKWNIPSAKANLAKAIKMHSLQAILSEVLIDQVCTDPDTTFFNYILAILKDLNELNIVDEPTETQAARIRQLEDYVENASEAPSPEEEDADLDKDVQAFMNINVDDDDPDEPEYGDPTHDLNIYDTSGEPEFTTSLRIGESPYDTKVSGIRTYIFGYSPNELKDLIAAIVTNKAEDPMDLPLEDIIRAFADGNIDVNKETHEARQIHASLNADLAQLFIECENLNGVQMNEELASHYDILCDSWDLRDDKTRKFYKLQNLIYEKGQEDPDLLAAIGDMEKFYLGE